MDCAAKIPSDLLSLLSEGLSRDITPCCLVEQHWLKPSSRSAAHRKEGVCAAAGRAAEYSLHLSLATIPWPSPSASKAIPWLSCLYTPMIEDGGMISHLSLSMGTITSTCSFHKEGIVEAHTESSSSRSSARTEEGQQFILHCLPLLWSFLVIVFFGVSCLSFLLQTRSTDIESMRS